MYSGHIHFEFLIYITSSGKYGIEAQLPGEHRSSRDKDANQQMFQNGSGNDWKVVKGELSILYDPFHLEREQRLVCVRTS